MPALTDWEELSRLIQEDRRQGKRVPLSFPIEVTGLDRAGRLFVERSITRDVSEWGCQIQLSTKLERGDIVAVRLLTRLCPHPDGNRPVLFEVVWFEHADGEWKAGLKKLQREKIWNMSFPPKNSAH